MPNNRPGLTWYDLNLWIYSPWHDYKTIHFLMSGEIKVNYLNQNLTMIPITIIGNNWLHNGPPCMWIHAKNPTKVGKIYLKSSFSKFGPIHRPTLRISEKIWITLVFWIQINFVWFKCRKHCNTVTYIALFLGVHNAIRATRDVFRTLQTQSKI